MWKRTTHHNTYSDSKTNIIINMTNKKTPNIAINKMQILTWMSWCKNKHDDKYYPEQQRSPQIQWSMKHHQNTINSEKRRHITQRIAIEKHPKHHREPWEKKIITVNALPKNVAYVTSCFHKFSMQNFYLIEATSHMCHFTKSTKNLYDCENCKFTFKLLLQLWNVPLFFTIDS